MDDIQMYANTFFYAVTEFLCAFWFEPHPHTIELIWTLTPPYWTNALLVQALPHVMQIEDINIFLLIEEWFPPCV